MRELSLNIQTFSLLREQKCIYVDKTRLVLQLISKIGKYFLSRPRRYGKSLLISLFEELFSGNKDLFEGLEITKAGYTFPKYPVIRIDFSAIGHSSATHFKDKLLERIQEIGKEKGIDLFSHDSIEGATRALIRGVAKEGLVVLLIDEYDCPILDWIEHPEVAAALQRVLKSFYATVKSEESHFRFIFVTGITKIAKTSNLTDLSFEDDYATLLGYTEEEIKGYFGDYLKQAAKEHNKTAEALLTDIRTWYNGYRFALKSDDPSKKVYSPLSVMSFFKTGIFDNYWFMTATPSFLAKLMKDNYLGFRELEITGMGSSILHPFDLEDISPVALAYQTGYLTIRQYEAGVFDLAYPNEEVRQSMTTYLLGA